MKKRSIGITSENPPLKPADIAAGKLVLRQRAADGSVLPAKQRVNIYLDSAIIEHFKAKAGPRGYQTLINESLREAMRRESLERVVRSAVRAEFKALKRAA
jgi:uncharacterized protein (DUF4415 family)